MQRFSLPRIRLIMQNQPYRNSFLNPTANAFTSRTRPPFSTSAPGGGLPREEARPYEDAWTPYDGLGPVPSPGRNPRFEGSWRSGGQSYNGGGRGGTSGSRGNHRGGSPVNQPASKRAKQMSQQGRGGAGTRGQSSPRGDRASVRGGFSRRDPGELIDEAYLERNYPKLQKEEFPNAPPALWNNPKAFLWDNKISYPKSVWATMRGNGVYTCTVFLRTPDNQRVEAVGEAKNKKIAERIACKHAVLKLHQLGQLSDTVYGGVHVGTFDRKLLNAEQDALIDIYDYCARFDTVPRITVSEAHRTGTKKGIIQVILEMPEQGIKASAKAPERRIADILASVEFKRQAEEWHAKHGDEDILIKDVANSINSRNAKKFFEFYKIHNPSCVYTCETRPARGSNRKLSGSHTEGQVYLNNERLGDPVEMAGKKNADVVAWVTAAVALKHKNPDMFEPFIEALRLGNGEILKPLSPQWINIDSESVASMTDTLLSVRRIGLPPSEEELALQENKTEDRRRHPRRKLDPALAEVKSKKMLAAYEAYLADEKLETLRRKRSELPMIQYTDHVLELVNNNEVSIIVGATGSGKTTQVPQILLEDAVKSGRGAECNVICTQPRRIAATSVAQRVAVERNEPLQQSIGYQVRFDSKLPLPGGSVTYCTTGILLQQLRHNPDEVLDGITHLVIDEVHERDIMIDYLLIILKRVLKNRRLNNKPGVKVVLMSATMDTELFAGYFGSKDEDGKFAGCPHLSVPGRTFPVKEMYLEDIKGMFSAYSKSQLSLLNDEDTRQYLAVEENFKPIVLASTPASANASAVPSRAVTPKAELEEDDGEATINWKQEVNITSSGQASVTTEKEDALVPTGLVALTLGHIAKTTEDGAILAFLPGLDEILKVEEILRTNRILNVDFTDTSKYKIYMLHSSIPNQNEVFEDLPEGIRKIILSTNIAETSITIPDVKFVVDTGKLREKQYEQARRITQLVCTWVSKSNSKQRAGRAGRVQNGNYYALFSRKRFETLRATGLPEMLRSDLQEICLDIKLQGFKDPIASFLSEAIEPPAPHAIDSSLRQLMALGAIDPNENLTQLGHVLATMPVEPALGKMILLAVIFRCLDPILILGASAGGRDIFVNPPDKRQEATKARHRFIGETRSDHMGVINAFREWRAVRDKEGAWAAHRFAEYNFLHRGSLKVLDQTAKQVEDILSEIGIIPRTRRGESLGSEYGHPRLNSNSDCIPLIKALTLAGMYPNLGICTGGRGFRTVSENFTMIHPSSVHYTPRDDRSTPIGAIMTYSSKAKSNDGSSILLRQNTESSALASLLFGGKLRWSGNTIEIDGWLPFRTRDQQAKITIEFKKCLDRLLAHAFRSLSQRGSNNGQTYLADDPARETFAQGLVEVLNYDAGIRNDRRRRGFGNEDNWRSSSRNESAFPPLGSDRPREVISRPGSRTADRWTGPDSRAGDRYGGPISRPDSRTDSRFPPPGSDRFAGPGSRPDSRTDSRFPPPGSDRFAGPGSRPDSRTDSRFPPPGSDRFAGPGSRPDSRTDSRFPPPGSDRQGSISRPNSRTGDRNEPRLADRWTPNSRPESRTGDRFSDARGGDRWTSSSRTDSQVDRFGVRGNGRYTPADVRSALPPDSFGNSSGGATDRYRPDSRIQSKWR
ncbi:P-loop containing nucleoside triphosphate hydrolase protein [Sphaerosporella brunnea]|uniref:P-loop containing nucleoside triphosphate hydrolase protein n=1 Tax=Sphaerosporella brunnea TaxID=1250544 RepID=A0A5J5F004_9PEZI|nr:P-loop containing nucleoside triphosphate hydrolase protein [Sphaerosporella brunnea]